jgi:glycosyltransferase involved in cell wall biosynthesis
VKKLMGSIGEEGSPPLNVLFMANVVPDPNSGAAGTEVQTIKALREAGHIVDAVWTDELSHRILHYKLYEFMELPFAYRRALIERFRRRRYDVVHVNQPYGHLAAHALRALDQRSVFVHRSHGFEPRVTRDLARWLERYEEDRRPKWRQLSTKLIDRCLSLHFYMIARNADGHIFSASECRDFLRDRYGVSSDRIAVIAQAPPPEYLTCEPAPMTYERLHRLLYVGQYAFIKAPMILRSAVERILQVLPKATMTWVCDRRHHSHVMQAFRPEFRERILTLDTGPQLDLMPVYDQHGIFLFPSFFEGFGKAFLEAMSRGLIVVAANNGGMKDVISHGRNGFLVPTGNANQMAEHAIWGTNSHTAFSMSTAARLHALEYSWKSVAYETATFYTELLAARRKWLAMH